MPNVPLSFSEQCMVERPVLMEVSQRMWTWLRMPLDVAQLSLLHLQAPLMVWKQNPKDLSATFTQMLMKYLTQNTGHCCSMDLQTASPVEALEEKQILGQLRRLSMGRKSMLP